MGYSNHARLIWNGEGLQLQSRNAISEEEIVLKVAYGI